MGREKFRIHDAATMEISEAISWYVDRGPNLADRFIAAVNEAIEKTLAAPDRFAKCIAGMRYVRVEMSLPLPTQAGGQTIGDLGLTTLKRPEFDLPVVAVIHATSCSRRGTISA